VNAPFSWPKSSLSSKPVGIAAQFSFTNACDLRELRLWTARAFDYARRSGLGNASRAERNNQTTQLGFEQPGLLHIVFFLILSELEQRLPASGST
jgi:hypothetical protein